MPSENPTIAFSGVLSSWETFDRNSDLARLADSAEPQFRAGADHADAHYVAAHHADDHGADSIDVRTDDLRFHGLSPTTRRPT